VVVDEISFLFFLLVGRVSFLADGFLLLLLSLS
jgi:hypothetical protein